MADILAGVSRGARAMNFSGERFHAAAEAGDLGVEIDGGNGDAHRRRRAGLLTYAAAECGADFVQNVVARHYRFDRARHSWRKDLGAGPGRSRWLSHPRTGPAFR